MSGDPVVQPSREDALRQRVRPRSPSTGYAHPTAPRQPEMPRASTTSFIGRVGNRETRYAKPTSPRVAPIFIDVTIDIRVNEKLPSGEGR